MITAARIFLPLFVITLLISACQTAQKYVESGDYDSAIDLCIRKIKGKPKKKLEYVQGLELAFKKAQARDLATIEQLKAENRPELWERIYGLYQNIKSRQNKVAPLTPLAAKNGYKAQFQFVDIGPLERSAREKAAEYLYSQAESLIGTAERGNKLAARKAYDLLNELHRKYYTNYKDKEQLKLKARDLGTSYVVVEVKNHSGKILPRTFAERMLTMDKQGLDTEWKEFSFEEKPGLHYDYKAVFKVRDIDISPERV